LDSNNFLIDVSNGGSATPASVMMPDMSSGGHPVLLMKYYNHFFMFYKV